MPGRLRSSFDGYNKPWGYSRSINSAMSQIEPIRFLSMQFRTLISLAAISLSGCSPLDEDERRARMYLPPASYVPSMERGGFVFKQNCATCHGIDAKGGPTGPPLVHSIYSRDHHADLAIHWAVRDGVNQHHWHFGNMPPQKHVSPKRVSDIVLWIREMQRRAGI